MQAALEGLTLSDAACMLLILFIDTVLLAYCFVGILCCWHIVLLAHFVGISRCWHTVTATLVAYIHTNTPPQQNAFTAKRLEVAQSPIICDYFIVHFHLQKVIYCEYLTGKRACVTPTYFLAIGILSNMYLRVGQS
jgi:hypothetical protein